MLSRRGHDEREEEAKKDMRIARITRQASELSDRLSRTVADIVSIVGPSSGPFETKESQKT